MTTTQSRETVQATHTTGALPPASLAGNRPQKGSPAPESLPPDPAFQLTPAAADTESAPPAPTRRHPSPLVVVRLVVLLLAASAGIWWYLTSDMSPWAQVDGPLTASGTLEADEILVAFEVAGRIVELVDEGQSLQAGDVVATLDDSLIQIQIQQAAVAQLQQLQIQADRFQLRSPIAVSYTHLTLPTNREV